MSDYLSSFYTVRKDGHEYGPFTGAEIIEMLKSSTLTLDDEVSSPNLEMWQRLRKSNIWHNYINS